VYAAPLVVAEVTVGGGAHDVVIAPTENNTVYALDAVTGAVLWQQHLAPPLTDVEYNDCINISPLHGITSTPVIDLERREIYVCGLTRAGLRQVYNVWPLDLASGAVKSGWPVTLQGSYKGTPFDGGQLTQRGALTMVDGWLYAPFSSRCDIGEWHGWVMGVNTRHPSASQRAFSPAPDASGGGMWGSAGLAADQDHNLYAVTGSQLLMAKATSLHLGECMTLVIPRGPTPDALLGDRPSALGRLTAARPCGAGLWPCLIYQPQRGCGYPRSG
jgi:hypothetical protein